METRRFQNSSTQEKQFKSYYVVWKLPQRGHNISDIGKFKSYYVVWKRFSLWRENKPQYLFKSYYVVWKPSNFARTPNAYFSV